MLRFSPSLTCCVFFSSWHYLCVFLNLHFSVFKYCMAMCFLMHPFVVYMHCIVEGIFNVHAAPLNWLPLSDKATTTACFFFLQWVISHYLYFTFHVSFYILFHVSTHIWFHVSFCISFHISYHIYHSKYFISYLISFHVSFHLSFHSVFHLWTSIEPTLRNEPSLLVSELHTVSSDASGPHSIVTGLSAHAD